jgi:alpha-beta hydrolase superfamily lysophospholipase
MDLRTGPLRPLLRRLFRPYLGHALPPPRQAEAVTIPGADGAALEGAVLDAGAGAWGVVVLCHPLMRSGYHYFLRGGLARWVAGAGLHAVLFNFQGVGRSALGGLCFADDVVGAVGWARRRFPGLPVHLAGHSFGGYHAAHALPRLDGAVASAALDSVPPRVGNVFRSGPASWLMRGLSRSPWAAATGTRPAAASLARVRRTPLLLLYGDADDYCPAEDVRRLTVAVPAARLELLPGAGHLDGFLVRRADYTWALLGHWGALAPEVRA